MTKGLSGLRWHARGWMLVFCLGYAVGLSANPLPPLGEALLTHHSTLSLDETFSAVATGIRYEPYAGVLRSPHATALARGGNAADQSVLLAELLRAKGYRVRFVQGTLEGDNLKTLIRGIYPPDLPTLDTPAEYAPFDPSYDAALHANAAAHTWLEVDQGNGSWLPLDPSFPGARIGEAYAQAATRTDKLPDKFCQRLVITLNEQTAAGKSRELGRVDECTARIGLQPLSLRIVGIPQIKAVSDNNKKGAADMFGGALSGADSKAQEPASTTPQPPERVGILYQRTLQQGSESIPMLPSLLVSAKPETTLKREWLRIEIQVPGTAPRVIERDLYTADAPGANAAGPGLYRRYGLVVMPGALDPAAVDAYLAAARKDIDLESMQSRLQAISDKPEALKEIVVLNDQIGALTGHWLGLSLGAELSELTERIAFNNAVTFAQALPRIVIVSLESEPGDATVFRTAIDLRLDEVEAWPYPGHAAHAKVNFQTARGMQNTIVEARFVERTLGLDEAANTINLMSRLEGGRRACSPSHPVTSSNLKRFKVSRLTQNS